MRIVHGIGIWLAATLLAGCSVIAPTTVSPSDLARQVGDTERAFANTMAQRDHAAFASFLSEEAVFFSGDTVLRGKTQVASAWKKFYEGPVAPFSWQPQTVEVLPSGTLALSSGPVHGANGQLIATFTSIWRLESTGVWRIIFDKGNAECNCSRP